MPLPNDRMLRIVAMYRAGQSMADIGERHKISTARVQQILNDYEKRTGDIVRRRPFNIGSPPALMVEWACPDCSAKRMVPMIVADRWEENGHICVKCSLQKQSMPVEIINKQISERLNGKLWTEMALEVGRLKNSSAYIQSPIYRHLLRAGDSATISKLWPRGIPKWLVKEINRRHRRGAGGTR